MLHTPATLVARPGGDASAPSPRRDLFSSTALDRATIRDSMSVLSLRVTGPELRQLRRAQHDAGMTSLSDYLRTRLGLARLPSGDNLAEELASFDLAEPERLHLVVANLAEEMRCLRSDVRRILTPLARPKPVPKTLPAAVADAFFPPPPTPEKVERWARRREKEAVASGELPEGWEL